MQKPKQVCVRLYPAGYRISITHKDGHYATLNERFRNKQACVEMAKKLAKHNDFEYIGVEDMTQYLN